MAHNKFAPQGSSHEKKLTRKERQEQRKKWQEELANIQPQTQPTQEIVPTAEDKDQLKRLGLIAGIVIVGLLFFMYYMFAFS